MAEINLTDLADLIDKSPDEATVSVPVKEMRAALWYYHNYWILVEERIAKDKLFDRYEKIVEEDAQTIKAQADTLGGYQTALPILIATTVAATILYIVEVIK